MFNWRSRFDGGEIRRLVVDANDGIIAGAGIIHALYVANYPEYVAVLAAFGAMVAGALSTGGATYWETSNDREAMQALVEEERRLLQLSPEEELKELTHIYVEKGVSADLARQVALELSAKDALAAHMQEELGISPDDLEEHPTVAASLSVIAFAFGALVPILVVLLTPDTWSDAALIVAVLAALVGTSVIAARSSRMNTWHTIRRTLVIAIGAVLLSTAVGLIG
ncbi:MAG TPA: VIT1/CCC1 transporter family protein [Arachnia sp.]|nr:VIT1/CCC1 transporter family protein [Arachnia sp.]HMT85659.1 VIT1/CCC1 transporter family protein [Arachnia sp.]